MFPLLAPPHIFHVRPLANKLLIVFVSEFPTCEMRVAHLSRSTLRINTVNSELLTLEEGLDKHNNGPKETQPSGRKWNSHAELAV